MLLRMRSIVFISCLQYCFLGFKRIFDYKALEEGILVLDLMYILMDVFA